MADDRFTVETLAEAKGIPVPLLTAYGVVPATGGVLISYGRENRARVRTTVRAGEGSQWAGGKLPIVPYGVHLEQTAKAVKQGRLFVVEGESDCWSAWYHLRAALGIPGANQTGKLAFEHVAGVDKVYVLREPDEAGGKFVAGVRDRFTEFETHGLEVPDLHELVLPGVKDLNELHLRHVGDRSGFRSTLDAAVADAPRIWPPDEALVALFASFAEGRGPWPVLSNDALHGLAGEVVQVWDPHTEADPAALLFELLAGFGNLVGRGPTAMGGQTHRTKLFPLIVGKTSRGRKGTGRDNIDLLLCEVDPDWAKGVIGGTASGEGIIRAADDRAGDPLLVLESEFSRVLKVAGRDGSIVSEVIRQAWDDTTLHNSTAKEPVHVYGAHITMVGHATAEELIRRMDDIDIFNGFANRFLLVAARRSKKLPSGGGLPDTQRDHLVEKLKTAAEQARTVTSMKRTPKAEEIWAEWYLSLPDDEPGLVGAVTARAEAQVLRLQMVYALLDGSAMIQADHVTAAIAAWDYCVQTAWWLFGDRLGDPDAELLIEALFDAPTGLGGTQIMAIYKRHRTAAQIDAIKERVDRWLQRHGMCLIEVREQTGGRPRVITRMVPLSGETSETSDQTTGPEQEPAA